MTQPVAPWSEYARSEWARIGVPLDEPDVDTWHFGADELRPPETDEEPWDVLDAAIVGTAGLAVAIAVVGGALAAVLVVVRRHPEGAAMTDPEVQALADPDPRVEAWFQTLNEDKHGLVRSTKGELRAMIAYIREVARGVRVAPSPTEALCDCGYGVPHYARPYRVAPAPTEDPGIAAIAGHVCGQCGRSNSRRVAPSPDAPGLREAAQALIDHLDRTGVHAPGPTGCIVYDHFDALRAALASEPVPATGLRWIGSGVSVSRQLAGEPVPATPACICGRAAPVVGTCFDIDGAYWSGHGEPVPATDRRASDGLPVNHPDRGWINGAPVSPEHPCPTCGCVGSATGRQP